MFQKYPQNNHPQMSPHVLTNNNCHPLKYNIKILK